MHSFVAPGQVPYTGRSRHSGSPVCRRIAPIARISHGREGPTGWGGIGCSAVLPTCGFSRLLFATRRLLAGDCGRPKTRIASLVVQEGARDGTVREGKFQTSIG